MVGPMQMPNPEEVRRQVEDEQLRREQLQGLAQERQYRADILKQEMEDRARAREAADWLGQQYQLHGKTDPETGDYTLNYEGLSNAALSRGYLDIAERIQKQGAAFQKAHEDLVKSQLTNRQAVAALKSAGLQGVQGAEDWPNFLSTMRNYMTPEQYKSAQLPQDYDEAWVTKQRDVTKQQIEAYQQMLDPQGY